MLHDVSSTRLAGGVIFLRMYDQSQELPTYILYSPFEADTIPAP